MQSDGKLARIVGQFETMCGTDKKPAKQLFHSITNILGAARTIWNPKSSGKAIIKSITDLNQKLDSLLSTIK
jgi:ABC-type proline/glycine betaine transport system substrate-binding protein